MEPRTLARNLENLRHALDQGFPRAQYLREGIEAALACIARLTQELLKAEAKSEEWRRLLEDAANYKDPVGYEALPFSLRNRIAHALSDEPVEVKCQDDQHDWPPASEISELNSKCRRCGAQGYIAPVEVQ